MNTNETTPEQIEAALHFLTLPIGELHPEHSAFSPLVSLRKEGESFRKCAVRIVRAALERERTRADNLDKELNDTLKELGGADRERREAHMQADRDAARADSCARECSDLKARAEKAEAELSAAHREAAHLAEVIFKRHYANDEAYTSGRSKWGLCDTVAGIISQIDNMHAGVAQELSAARAEVAECRRLLRAHGRELGTQDNAIKSMKQRNAQLEQALQEDINVMRRCADWLGPDQWRSTAEALWTRCEQIHPLAYRKAPDEAQPNTTQGQAAQPADANAQVLATGSAQSPYCIAHVEPINGGMGPNWDEVRLKNGVILQIGEEGITVWKTNEDYQSAENDRILAGIHFDYPPHKQRAAGQEGAQQG